jgi:hypothetical protein
MRIPLNTLTLTLALTTALTMGACDDETPTSPSSTAPTLNSTLTFANEFPPLPLPNPDSSATGNVVVKMNVLRNASGAITEANADFTVTLSGFPANTTLTGAHIHPGRAGTSGGIVVNTGIVAGDIVLANGAGSFSRNGIAVTADLATQILNDPTAFYFNVHTTVNTGGAVRGQLVMQ